MSPAVLVAVAVRIQPLDTPLSGIEKLPLELATPLAMKILPSPLFSPFGSLVVLLSARKISTAQFAQAVPVAMLVVAELMRG